MLYASQALPILVPALSLLARDILGSWSCPAGKLGFGLSFARAGAFWSFFGAILPVGVYTREAWLCLDCVSSFARRDGRALFFSVRSCAVVWLLLGRVGSDFFKWCQIAKDGIGSELRVLAACLRICVGHALKLYAEGPRLFACFKRALCLRTAPWFVAVPPSCCLLSSNSTTFLCCHACKPDPGRNLFARLVPDV